VPEIFAASPSAQRTGVQLRAPEGARSPTDKPACCKRLFVIGAPAWSGPGKTWKVDPVATDQLPDWDETAHTYMANRGAGIGGRRPSAHSFWEPAIDEKG
jgi:hypothetical protein